MKLHIGCGGIRLSDDFINVDIRQVGKADIIARAEELPFKDNSFDRMESYHLIEHIEHLIVPEMLREWFRVMCKNATLRIECPDFDKTVEEYLEGNEKRIYNIYGLQRFPNDNHFFGYNFKRLNEVLLNAGFMEILQQEAVDYHSKDEPCLAVECKKGENK